MPHTIRRICQYCGNDIGTKEGHGVTGISHGTCDDCAKLDDDAAMLVYIKRTAGQK